MVLLTKGIGKARHVVDPPALLRNPIQESRVLEVGFVAIGFGPTNTEIEYWFHFLPGNSEVFESRTEESDRGNITLQRMFGRGLSEYEIGRNYIIYVQPGNDGGCQR